MEIRNQLISALLRNFLKDLDLSAKPFADTQDRIDFLLLLLEFSGGVNSIAENDHFDTGYFDGEAFVREKLLAKYHYKMTPFVVTKLRLYFYQDEYNQELLFKKLNIEQQILNYDEYIDYIVRVNFILSTIVENLYLKIGAPTQQASPEENLGLLNENTDEIVTRKFKSQSIEYTRNRQILLYHYVLKLSDISRRDTSVRKLAQFAHVLFAYPTDNIDSSPVYKKLKQAPNLNGKKGLLIDLAYIKEQFELIGNEAGAALVQKDIEEAKRKP